MTMRASYVAGTWVAIASPRLWLLVDLPAQDDLVSRCWAHLNGHDDDPVGQVDVDELLDVLVWNGLRNAPSFALARADDQDIRLVVRGAGRAVVDGVDHAADASRSWLDVTVPVGEVLLTSIAAVDGSALPMASGVTQASAIRLRPATDVPAPTPVGSTILLSNIRAGALDEPAPPDVAADGEPSWSEVVQTSTDLSEPSAVEPSAVEPAAVEPVISEQAAPAPGARSDESAPAESAEAAATVGGEATYDHLFGATQHPGSLPAVPKVPEPEPTPEPPTVEGAPSSRTASWQYTSSWTGPDAAPPGESNGLIDAVPWTPSDAQPASAPPVQFGWNPAPVSPPPVSDAGMAYDLLEQPPYSPEVQIPPPPGYPAPYASSIAYPPPPPSAHPQASPYGQQPSYPPLPPARSPYARPVEGAAPPPPPAPPFPSQLPGLPAPGATIVMAGYCPAQHLSPVHAPTCRVCGLPMPPQAGFEVPRPPLGVIRLSTGNVVTLDRGVYLGRAPVVPPDDPEQSHAIRLPSPESDISRSHARIELDGWSVYLSDLGSTNGTIVTLPGREPERLRPWDPIMLQHGATVSLADEVTLVFEVTP